MAKKRHACIGAEPIKGGVHFRVWAPAHQRVAVAFDGEEHPLENEANGYFSALIAGAKAGTRYRFRLDDETEAWPDPASRFQPDGPHGPSEVIDPSSFAWSDEKWKGRDRKGLVIAEIHIGTFTPEGTFRAAIGHLADLADAGMNAVEVMPVNEFPGRFGWGYDGVDLWSPTQLYGRPDDFRAFIDSAHNLGISVLLDVVYNHLGPDGCYLTKFTPRYFTKKYKNEWGEALNFDGDDAHGVREYVTENAAYWIREFHLDGLRIDATQSIFDERRPHILKDIVDRARAAAGDRQIHLIAENEPQDRKIITEFGLDAMWNDDWHHSTRVAATGFREAYYSDYRGTAQELLSMAKSGFLYQGQYYSWQKKRRGTASADLKPERLIVYLENHDQLANSATGDRLHAQTSPGRLRALTALLLLLPQTPMLFQGQEFGASAPFLYFADHKPELAASVQKGRREFLSQFPSLAGAEAQEALAAPHDPKTFERCRLDWSERARNASIVALHRDLLALRRTDETFRQQRTDVLTGAVFSDSALALRWTLDGRLDRLLLVNLEDELEIKPVNEPILAPPPDRSWKLLWSSEANVAVDGENCWRMPAECALVFAPSQ